MDTYPYPYPYPYPHPIPPAPAPSQHSPHRVRTEPTEPTCPHFVEGPTFPQMGHFSPFVNSSIWSVELVLALVLALGTLPRRMKVGMVRGKSGASWDPLLGVDRARHTLDSFKKSYSRGASPRLIAAFGKHRERRVLRFEEGSRL